MVADEGREDDGGIGAGGNLYVAYTHNGRVKVVGVAELAIWVARLKLIVFQCLRAGSVSHGGRRRIGVYPASHVGGPGRARRRDVGPCGKLMAA